VSCNIVSIDIVASEGFAIPRTIWRELALGETSKLMEAPEDSFLNPHWPKQDCDDVRGILFVNRMPWRCEGSGNSWDLFKQLLPHFLGSADLIVTWEGGNGCSGLRLLNGKVTEHEVVMALGKEKP
jgi:hypothetical protein